MLIPDHSALTQYLRTACYSLRVPGGEITIRTLWAGSHRSKTCHTLNPRIQLNIAGDHKSEHLNDGSRAGSLDFSLSKVSLSELRSSTGLGGNQALNDGFGINDHGTQSQSRGVQLANLRGGGGGGEVEPEEEGEPKPLTGVLQFPEEEPEEELDDKYNRYK